MRNMSWGLATLAVVAIAAPTYGKCTCSLAKVDNGWCADCKVGMVGNAAYKDKDDYENAVNAREIVVAAAESKCESCAVAMVTDGTCAACKVAYQGAKKTKLTRP